MNILVTGSNGFIGKNLIPDLISRFPNTNIFCLVRQNNLSKNNRHIKYFTINYLDKKSLLNSSAFNHIDYIYHLAGVTKSPGKKGFWAGNVIPLKNILEVLNEKKIKLKRFVLISSQTVSGFSKSENHYITENEPNNQIELYGKSKLEAENILTKYKHEIPFTIISPAAVYGPWDVDFYNIFKMTKFGLNIYAGNKKQVVSLIYVKDLTKAIIDSAISERTINEKYFICDDSPKSWEEIQNTIFKISGKKKIDITIPYSILNVLSYFGSLYSLVTNKPILLNRNKIKLSKPNFWLCSNKKAKEHFNFRAIYSLEEALKETYSWYKQNNWL